MRHGERRVAANRGLVRERRAGEIPLTEARRADGHVQVRFVFDIRARSALEVFGRLLRHGARVRELTVQEVHDSLGVPRARVLGVAREHGVQRALGVLQRAGFDTRRRRVEILAGSTTFNGAALAAASGRDEHLLVEGLAAGVLHQQALPRPVRVPQPAHPADGGEERRRRRRCVRPRQRRGVRRRGRREKREPRLVRHAPGAVHRRAHLGAERAVRAHARRLRGPRARPGQKAGRARLARRRASVGGEEKVVARRARRAPRRRRDGSRRATFANGGSRGGGDGAWRAYLALGHAPRARGVAHGARRARLRVARRGKRANAANLANARPRGADFGGDARARGAMRLERRREHRRAHVQGPARDRGIQRLDHARVLLHVPRPPQRCGEQDAGHGDVEVHQHASRAHRLHDDIGGDGAAARRRRDARLESRLVERGGVAIQPQRHRGRRVRAGGQRGGHWRRRGGRGRGGGVAAAEVAKDERTRRRRRAPSRQMSPSPRDTPSARLRLRRRSRCLRDTRGRSRRSSRQWRC